MVNLSDTTSEIGQRLHKRLQEEQTIWLTTVNQNGTPNPSLVWFLWEDDSILVLSQPAQGKVKAIRGNPHVSLNFDSDGHGGDMLILTGTAELLAEMSVDDVPAAYFTKYESGLKDLGYTPADMIANYHQPIRITIDRVRGH